MTRVRYPFNMNLETLITAKREELLALEYSYRGDNNWETNWDEIKTLLESSLSDAYVQGLEDANDVLEEVHKEVNLAPHFPGGASERTKIAQDTILHRVSKKLNALMPAKKEEKEWERVKIKWRGALWEVLDGIVPRELFEQDFEEMWRDAQAVQKTSLIKRVEGMKLDITPDIAKYPDDQEMQVRVANEITIHNQALNDVIKALTND